MTDKNKTKPETKIVQTGMGADPAYGSIAPPLYLSSTYLWPNLTDKGSYDYGRSNNPNRDILAETIAQMDGGAGAVVTSSGMSAIDLVLNLINADDLLIAPHDCYGGTHRLLIFVNQTDSKALAEALKQKPAMVMVETPSNPLMRVVDVKAVCTAAKAAGAITVVDNTFLTPLRLKPLELGADIALQSTTKYINGHSDMIGGCVVAKSEEYVEKLAWWANASGVTAEANALAIATFLDTQEAVLKVNYPGLPSDAGHDLMQAQQSGPGAMLSFEVKGGLGAATKFCQSLEIFGIAASLGGVESLVCLPETMTHGGMEETARREAGISDSLLRLSVGIESESDLLADLAKGFSAIS